MDRGQTWKTIVVRLCQLWGLETDRRWQILWELTQRIWCRNQDVCDREGYSYNSFLELDGRKIKNYIDTEKLQWLPLTFLDLKVRKEYYYTPNWILLFGQKEMQKKVREEPGQDGQDSDLQTEVLTERYSDTDILTRTTRCSLLSILEELWYQFLQVWKKAVIFKRNFLNVTLSIINVYIVIIFHSTDNK